MFIASLVMVSAAVALLMYGTGNRPKALGGERASTGETVEMPDTRYATEPPPRAEHTLVDWEKEERYDTYSNPLTHWSHNRVDHADGTTTWKHITDTEIPEGAYAHPT